MTAIPDSKDVYKSCVPDEVYNKFLGNGGDFNEAVQNASKVSITMRTPSLTPALLSHKEIIRPEIVINPPSIGVNVNHWPSASISTMTFKAYLLSVPLKVPQWTQSIGISDSLSALPTIVYAVQLFPVEEPWKGTKQNVGLPQPDGHNSVEDRLIYVVHYFIDNGFYVILENHLSQEKNGDRDGTIIPNNFGNAATSGMSTLACLLLSHPPGI